MNTSHQSNLILQWLHHMCAVPILPLLLLALPAAVQAQFTYVTNQGSITITGYTGPSGAVSIPSTINGRPVTGIGFQAFAGSASLTSLAIPASVTNIGGQAFIVCPSLTAITVATNNPVYSSRDGVLFDKAQSTLIEYPPGKVGSYTVPDSVSVVSGYAMYCCYNLTALKFPNSVTVIGDWAFAQCYNLTNVAMPASLQFLGASAFWHCDGLIEVALPESVATIGQGAFADCTRLARVNIPNRVTSIEYAVFRYCAALASITIPESVTRIDDQAFWSSGLTNIILPNSVTSIGYEAFAGCNLTDVFIPSTLVSIGDRPFHVCVNLKAITVEASNPAYSSSGGALLDKNQMVLLEHPAGRPGTYTVPNGVINIKDYAFYQCTLLTSLELPDSVTSVGSWACYSCVSLTNLTGGNGLTNIGDFALYNCDHLPRFTIGDRVARIGYEAFGFCRGLSSITIPDTVASIESYAFHDCNNLAGVVIGHGVTNIGSYAFSGTALTNVVIPNGVRSVANGTFDACSRLASVIIPRSVTNLGSAAFMSCTGLTAVYFQGDAPSVAFNTFSGDTIATAYYLPGTTGWGPTYGGLPTALWPPPTIQQPPPTQTAEAGSTVGFRVRATTAGDLVLGYQWFFNGITRLSCTNDVLQLTNVQYSQSGAYTVVVTNAVGAVTSAPVMLQVIAPVERRLVPAINLFGDAGSLLNLDYANSIAPTPNWLLLDTVSLVSTSQLYFDITAPLPMQRFYRAWQSGTPSGLPALSLPGMVPALTLAGGFGDKVRVDAINQVGPTDAWFTLDTVTLTNATQVYFDVSAPAQPSRLYRLVPVP